MRFALHNSAVLLVLGLWACGENHAAPTEASLPTDEPAEVGTVVSGYGNVTIDGATVTAICFGKGNDAGGGIWGPAVFIRWFSGERAEVSCDYGDGSRGGRINSISVPGADGDWSGAVQFFDGPFDFQPHCDIAGSGDTKQPIQCVLGDAQHSSSEDLSEFYSSAVVKSGVLVTIR